MTKTTASLETFDFLELLYMLSSGGKTGVLSVFRSDGQFQCWLQEGRIRHLQFGSLQGIAAVVQLLLDPRGRFQFDEGLLFPTPTMDVPMDEVAMEALEVLPNQTELFDGPARITSPQRVAAMRWSLKEKDVLQQIEAQRPLSELARDPEARRLLTKLLRIKLISPRKSRVARLTITATREVRGVVIVDELILRRWKEDLIRTPQNIAVRNDSGQVYTLAVRSGPDLGAQLLVPLDVLMRTGLHAGDSVLVRPV